MDKKHLRSGRLQELQHDIQAGELFEGDHQLGRWIQCGSNLQRLDRHTANTIFNVMRGGGHFDAYSVPTSDLRITLQFNGIPIN